jgi:thioesterase domain-containing protein
VDAVFRRFPDGTLESLGLTKSNVETWARVNEGTRIISEKYSPEGTVSKYDLFWVPPAPLFRCTDDQWYHEFLGAWKNYVNEPVREHLVAGSHFSILHGENIDVFQKALNRALLDRGL